MSVLAALTTVQMIYIGLVILALFIYFKNPKMGKNLVKVALVLSMIGLGVYFAREYPLLVSRLINSLKVIV